MQPHDLRALARNQEEPSRYGRARRIANRQGLYPAWMSVKMAVVPPMPRASVKTAVAVKTRARSNKE
jgi:hypothetical protein